jgi:hypothetical protein
VGESVMDVADSEEPEIEFQRYQEALDWALLKHGVLTDSAPLPVARIVRSSWVRRLFRRMCAILLG